MVAKFSARILILGLSAFLWGCSGSCSDSSPSSSTGSRGDGCAGSVWHEATQSMWDVQCLGSSSGYSCTCTPPENSGQPINEQVSADTCEEAASICGEFPDCGGEPESGGGYCWASGDGQWNCLCPEESERVASSGTTCSEALNNACAKPCSSADGECIPSNELGYFDCECGDDSVTQQIYGPSCEDALANSCSPSESCSNEQGDTCESSSSDMAGEFTCDCSYYQEARRVVVDDCESALSACNPQEQSYCGGWMGFCDEITLDDGSAGFDCQCIDGTSGERTAGDFGEPGAPDCDAALADVCGAEPPRGSPCPVESSPEDYPGTYEISCTPILLPSGEKGFDCSCTWSCDDGTGGSTDGTGARADSCEDAINSMGCADNC